MSNKIIISRDELYEMFISKDMSQKEIAEHLGCCRDIVGRRLKEYNIVKYSNGKNNKQYNITKEQLYKYYIEEKLNTYQIAEKIGCTQTAIRNNLKKFGLTWEDQLNDYQLTDLQYDIIIGSLLGDGAIGNAHKRKFFRISHNEPQKDYLYVTFNLFKNLCNIEEPMVISKESRINKTYTFYTKCLPVYDQFVNMDTYELLDRLNENSLLIWIMDDGSLQSKKYYRLAASRFDANELEYTIKTFKNKFDIDVVKHWKNKEQGKICGVSFNLEGSKRLKKVLKRSALYEEIRKVMEYKFIDD